jgi:PAS domain-containing protein
VLSSWGDKLHPDDKERTLDAFAQHLLDRTGNTPYDLEYRLLKKNGEYSYYHAFGATIRDEEGYALRVTGAIQDITKDKDIVNEMRRRETELQEVLIKSQKSEKGFREKVHWYEALLDAFEESPISVTDMNKNLTFLNKAALTILGTTREATMGKYCGDVWNVDICKDERCGIECLKCGKGKSEFQVGDVTFTTLASYIKDSEGNNIGHIEVVDNITQIANKDFEMQQFYNAIFETDNVVEFASDAIITAVNQNFLNLWQADRSAFIGKHLSAFVGEDAFNEIKTTVRKGKIFDEEMNMTVGGKQMRCNLTFVPINDKQGNMLRVLLLADVEE